MATMNISLPDTMKSFVDVQLASGGYSTSSEYIRDLIRRDQVLMAERQLAALINEGLASGEPIPVDDKFWEERISILQKKFEN